jgi:DNA-binding PadR family transcriptional regulator
VESPLSTRGAILLALRRGPGCGLAIIERLERSTGGAVRPAEGSVYPLLNRLAREGLVRRLPLRAEGRPGRARVDYELTPNGMAASDQVKRALQGLTAGPLDRFEPGLDSQMQDRVHEASELSDFGLRLRDQVASHRGAGR